MHVSHLCMLIALDSTVLAELMFVLNARHHYGLNLFLLSVDEGIVGYRDDSLAVRGCILTINLSMYFRP